ncbi:MAG: aminotransferase class I/II-fold pyridoxal phosphate-dependent enzyme [Planctomycetes bacterium]|nr:aminotransferase class I/II-fold pyridoxal phosphate-dependent enzyme [Planctomycetota bacterium]
MLAGRMNSLPSSGIRRVFDLAAALKDPIDLSMGQPNFDVPEPIKQAAISAIRDGYNGYTVTQGIPELRERISRSLAQEFDWQPSVLVTSGVSGGLTLALMATINPGDEVIVPDPYFVSYPHLVELCGGKAVTVSLYDSFRLDPQRIANALTDRTKAIMVNSPGNPTGTVHAAEDIEAVSRLARDRGLLVISDEIYNRLCYDGPASSPVQFAPEQTLLLRGFGKTYGMTGWRMGFAAGPTDIIAAMAKLQQYTFVCAPHMAQRGCLAAFDTDMTDQIDAYRRKRDLAVAELANHFEFVAPSGGFFVFAKVPKRYESGERFMEAALAKNVLLIPGHAFSRRDTHFRISYAVDNERLRRGCSILRDLAG